jgi:hypothetical protein
MVMMMEMIINKSVEKGGRIYPQIAQIRRAGKSF